MTLSETEKKIAKEAGQRGGAYLDSIKKYDVRELTESQWLVFIQTVLFSDQVPF